jgi:hypothetical protein
MDGLTLSHGTNCATGYPPLPEDPKYPKGNCYENVVNYIQDNKLQELAFIVHGIVQSVRHGDFHHAWIELNDSDVLVDPTEGITQHRKVYYGMHEAKKVNTYTYKEAAVMMLSHGHYGPWTEYTTE